MSMIANTLKLLSVNCQGLRDKKMDRCFKLPKGIRCRNNLLTRYLPNRKRSPINQNDLEQ